MCTNQLHLPKNCRERLKLVSKMALKKSNTNFRLGHSDRTNKTTFQAFRYSRKFSTETTQKIVFNLFSNRIFRKLFENGKQGIGQKGLNGWSKGVPT